MTLHELDSPAAVETFKSANANALICFSATWCGPCRSSKPTLVELAGQYERDPTIDLKVGIAYEHNLSDAIHQYRVKAFPTYVLFVSNGTSEAGRIEGANFDGIRGLVEKAGCKKSLGEGYSLGGGGEGDSRKLTPEEARALRLAKFNVAAPAATAGETGSAASPVETKDEEPPVKDVEMKDAETKDAGDGVDTKPAAGDAAASEADISTETEPEKEMCIPLVNPADALDKDALETLTSSMGFSLLRAQKGLLNGNGGTVEGAVEWLLQHQEDADIDDPIPLVPKEKLEAAQSAGGAVAQSYKCNDCGKILSNMANLELHANKTGHSDFEESTEVVKPLTAEEKAAKVEEIKQLLKAKRTEREEKEKAEDVDREKQRRFMGKEMAKTREEMEIEARKREAKQRKREKEASKRERERIKAELAKDKAERMANKGKLQSKLGVEGYNPDAIQYDDGKEPEVVHKKHHQSKASAAKIDDYIKKVSGYRAGGDGGKCLKVLLAYVGNVVDKPDEEKFRTINMENKAFKTKVKPFVGAKHLLLAVGFSPTEGGDALVLKEDADRNLLTETKAKLEAAYAAY